MKILYSQEKVHIWSHTSPFSFQSWRDFQLKKIDNFAPGLNFTVLTSNSCVYYG